MRYLFNCLICLLLFLLGCSPGHKTKLIKKAVIELNCPEEALNFVDLDAVSKGIYGCKRKITYGTPKNSFNYPSAYYSYWYSEKLVSRFDKIGNLSLEENEVPVLVESPDDIKIYYKNSPKGFTLRENELKVEDGYNHKILGFIKVRLEKGDCKDLEVNKSNILWIMKNRAAFEGANAVIYAYSRVSENPSWREKWVVSI